MIKFFIALFFPLYAIGYSQINKINGKWILDKETELDGGLLPINDISFSKYETYKFQNNKLEITGVEIPITINLNKINTPGFEFEYEFKDNYLILKNLTTKKILWLLRPESFLDIYPDFQPKVQELDGRTVYIENEVFTADFNYKSGFNEYLRKIYLDYNYFPDRENYSKIQFVVTKDSKIDNLKILESFSNDLDKKIITQVQNGERLFHNTTGKDILFIREQNFRTSDGMFVSSGFDSNFNAKKDNLKTKDRDKILKVIEKGDSYYVNNKFKEFIELYEGINLIKYSNIFKSSYLNSKFIKLGVSYLAVGNIDSACNNFQSAGGLANFYSRNYILNFCKDK